MTDLIEQLQEAGIEAADYERGPLGKEVFAIAINRRVKGGQIRIHPGVAEITVRTDKRYRQAVLDVVEKSRQITRKVSFQSYYNDDPRRLRERAMGAFPVALPRRRTTFAVSLDSSEIKDRLGLYRIDASITARVRPSHQSFLIGFDERYHFVAALPRQANSVVEAHRILRPTPVRRANQRVLRQGEWFFIPVSEVMQGRLDKQVPRRVRRVQLGRTTHHAASAIGHLSTTLYVRGFVYDSRPTHHAPLFLPKWHRVVRNREIQVRTPLTRTWD